MLFISKKPDGRPGRALKPAREIEQKRIAFVQTKYVSYFDPDARSKIVEVKFGAGLKLDINRPWKPFGGSGKEGKVLDLKKFRVDSDGAIKIATSQQLLQPFTLKYTQLWLRRDDDGLNWKVRLWAAKLGKSDAISEVGDLYISPEDGKVVRADLHIERLN